MSKVRGMKSVQDKGTEAFSKVQERTMTYDNQTEEIQQSGE